MILCSFPVRDGDPCRKTAVAEYLVDGEWRPRCKLHDGKAARVSASEKGYVRRPISEATAA